MQEAIFGAVGPRCDDLELDGAVVVPESEALALSAEVSVLHQRHRSSCHVHQPSQSALSGRCFLASSGCRKFDPVCRLLKANWLIGTLEESDLQGVAYTSRHASRDPVVCLKKRPA